MKWSCKKFRSSRLEVFFTKGILKNFAKLAGKHLCQSLFFKKVAGFRPWTYNFILKKEALAWVFSCEFCKNFKNTYYYRTPLVAASETNQVFSTKITKFMNDLFPKKSKTLNNYKIYILKVLIFMQCIKTSMSLQIFQFHSTK